MARKNDGALLALLGLGALLFVGKKPTPPPVDHIPGETDADPQGVQSFSAQFYRSTAEALYALMFMDFTEDEAAVIRTMLLMRTTRDVELLVAAFGTRRFFADFASGTLSQFIVRYLDQDERHAINMAYARKGINYRF